MEGDGMKRQTIFQTLEGLVKLRSGLKSDIASDARFKEDLDLDSLLVVDIVIDIEKQYDISLPEEDIARMATLDDAVSLVERLLAGSVDSVDEGNGAQEELQTGLLGGVGDLG
jgi:acyl carrier protein